MKALCILPEVFRLYADSAAHRTNQPVFLPDVEGGWIARICPAVKISRLGMHISEKFASRYYDSFTVACLFVPSQASDDLTNLDERYFAMDSAYAAGDWVTTVNEKSVFEVLMGDKSFSFSAESLNVNSIIAELSTFMTFKMGDTLIFAHPYVCCPISEGDRLCADLNGERVLDVKIK